MFKVNQMLLLGILLTGCQSSPQKASTTSQSPKHEVKKATVTKQPDTIKNNLKVDNSDELIYQDDSFSSYSEKKRRGTGVISFNLDLKDKLIILNEDGSLFGQLVLNEDQSYNTLNMPQTTVARNVIPHFDFAAFDFDAEPVKSNDDYLRIYVNRQLRKVKKAGVKYSFQTWNQYLTSLKDTTDASEN